MKRRLHVSWHIAAAGAGVLLGTVSALLSATALFASMAWMILAGALLILALTKRRRWLLVFSLLGGLLIGLTSGATEQRHLSLYDQYYGEYVTVSGVVAGDTTITADGDQQMRLKDIRIDGTQLHGKIWVNTSSNTEIKRGDHVSVQGVLGEGFGNIAASLFRGSVTKVYRPEPGDVGRRVRDWFAVQVRKALPEPQASLGVSYLAGQRQALPEGLEDQLRLLGLIHLVVASGFHLTLVVRFIRKPLSGVSKYLTAAGGLALIGGFLLISGFSTSMIRASLVTGISLLAWYYGRKVHPVVLLLFVAAVTALLDPSFLWGDMGWYLSFAAFAGVIILAPLLHRYFWGEKEPGFFRHLIVASIAAQITTFPIIAHAFGQYSPLALLANLLIQPLVSVAMLLTFISGLSAVFAPGLAVIVGWPAYIVLSYMTRIADWLAALPWAQGEIAITAAVVGACYLGITGGVLFLWRRSGHSFRDANIIE